MEEYSDDDFEVESEAAPSPAPPMPNPPQDNKRKSPSPRKHWKHGADSDSNSEGEEEGKSTPKSPTNGLPALSEPKHNILPPSTAPSRPHFTGRSTTSASATTAEPSSSNSRRGKEEDKEEGACRVLDKELKRFCSDWRVKNVEALPESVFAAHSIDVSKPIGVTEFRAMLDSMGICVGESDLDDAATEAVVAYYMKHFLCVSGSSSLLVDIADMEDYFFPPRHSESVDLLVRSILRSAAGRSEEEEDEFADAITAPRLMHLIEGDESAVAITMDAFRDFLRHRACSLTRTEARRSLQLLDADGDGAVTMADVEVLCRSLAEAARMSPRSKGGGGTSSSSGRRRSRLADVMEVILNTCDFEFDGNASAFFKKLDKAKRRFLTDSTLEEALEENDVPLRSGDMNLLIDAMGDSDGFVSETAFTTALEEWRLKIDGPTDTSTSASIGTGTGTSTGATASAGAGTDSASTTTTISSPTTTTTTTTTSVTGTINDNTAGEYAAPMAHDSLSSVGTAAAVADSNPPSDTTTTATATASNPTTTVTTSTANTTSSSFPTAPEVAAISSSEGVLLLSDEAIADLLTGTQESIEPPRAALDVCPDNSSSNSSSSSSSSSSSNSSSSSGSNDAGDIHGGVSASGEQQLQQKLSGGDSAAALVVAASEGAALFEHKEEEEDKEDEEVNEDNIAPHNDHNIHIDGDTDVDNNNNSSTGLPRSDSNASSLDVLAGDFLLATTTTTATSTRNTTTTAAAGASLDDDDDLLVAHNDDDDDGMTIATTTTTTYDNYDPNDAGPLSPEPQPLPEQSIPLPVPPLTTTTTSTTTAATSGTTGTTSTTTAKDDVVASSVVVVLDDVIHISPLPPSNTVTMRMMPEPQSEQNGLSSSSTGTSTNTTSTIINTTSTINIPTMSTTSTSSSPTKSTAGTSSSPSTSRNHSTSSSRTYYRPEHSYGETEYSRHIKELRKQREVNSTCTINSTGTSKSPTISSSLSLSPGSRSSSSGRPPFSPSKASPIIYSPLSRYETVEEVSITSSNRNRNSTSSNRNSNSSNRNRNSTSPGLRNNAGSHLYDELVNQSSDKSRSSSNRRSSSSEQKQRSRMSPVKKGSHRSSPINISSSTSGNSTSNSNSTSNHYQQAFPKGVVSQSQRRAGEDAVRSPNNDIHKNSTTIANTVTTNTTATATTDMSRPQRSSKSPARPPAALSTNWKSNATSSNITSTTSSNITSTTSSSSRSNDLTSAKRSGVSPSLRSSNAVSAHRHIQPTTALSTNESRISSHTSIRSNMSRSASAKSTSTSSSIGGITGAQGNALALNNRIAKAEVNLDSLKRHVDKANRALSANVASQIETLQKSVKDLQKTQSDMKLKQDKTAKDLSRIEREGDRDNAAIRKRADVMESRISNLDRSITDGIARVTTKAELLSRDITDVKSLISRIKVDSSSHSNSRSRSTTRSLSVPRPQRPVPAAALVVTSRRSNSDSNTISSGSVDRHPPSITSHSSSSSTVTMAHQRVVRSKSAPQTRRPAVSALSSNSNSSNSSSSSRSSNSNRNRSRGSTTEEGGARAGRAVVRDHVANLGRPVTTSIRTSTTSASRALSRKNTSTTDDKLRTVSDALLYTSTSGPESFEECEEEEFHRRFGALMTVDFETGLDIIEESEPPQNEEVVVEMKPTSMRKSGPIVNAESYCKDPTLLNRTSDGIILSSLEATPLWWAGVLARKKAAEQRGASRANAPM